MMPTVTHGMWIATLLLVAGCGGSATVPVAGKVVFQDGSPATELAGYLVNLDSQELQLSANGVVQPDGSFAVGTHDVDDGALPGRYKVALTPPEPPLDGPAPPAVIDPKYSDFNKSGLEVEITPDSPQVTLTVQKLKS